MASNPQSPAAASPRKSPGAGASPAGTPLPQAPSDGQSPLSASAAAATATGAENTIEPEAGPEAHEVVEAERDARGYAQDEDEGLASDAASSSSTSISSSVRDYVFENNRRYHKYQEGRYLIPNDEPEQEREDMKHAMIVTVCDGQLHFAPISNPQRILDIGTGTGIWAIDMGDEYPGAEVIGIDLSPIQPKWVPPNVKFMVDDAEQEWLFGSNTFDLVHARFVCMAIKNWPQLLTRAYDAIKPGGWIELQELRFVVQCDDDSRPADYGYGRLTELLMDGFRAFGIDPLSMERNAELLLDGGFENVREKVWKVPIGTWPRDPKLKKAGLYNRAMLYDALQAVSLAPLTRGLKWTPAEVEVFLVEVRKSLLDASIHTYLTFHSVYGQKPMS